MHAIEACDGIGDIRLTEEEMTRIRGLAVVLVLAAVALIVLGGCSSKKVTPRPPFPTLSLSMPAAVFETCPSAIKQSV